MSHTADLYVWLVLPYVSMALFAGGHVWRYRRDQLGWTSRSTQLLENRMLAWGSVMFHYGTLAVIAGHIIGILIPEHATKSIGISEHVYRIYISAIPGSVSGLVCVVGFAILAFRRSANSRVRVTTTAGDLIVFVLLGVLIVLGDIQTMGYNLFGSGYDYRVSVGPWFRTLFYDPRPSLMAGAPVAYQLHAALPWLLYAVWPFSRLVHAWSIPFQYLGRPYILYRRRYATAAR